MPFPSLDPVYRDGLNIKPRVLVLTVRDPKKMEESAVVNLLVERVETFGSDSHVKIDDARIAINYQVIGQQFGLYFNDSCARGFFGGKYCSIEHSVSLTCGSVFLNLPGFEGLRIGTYLMSEIVRWAKQWPDAQIQTITLNGGQAIETAEKLRRNRFYEQFGIVFQYDSDERISGASVPMLASSLELDAACESWSRNIEERTIVDWSNSHLRAVNNLAFELAHSQKLNAAIQMELTTAKRRPFIWAMCQRKYHMLWGLAAALIGSIVWLRLGQS